MKHRTALLRSHAVVSDGQHLLALGVPPVAPLPALPHVVPPEHFHAPDPQTLIFNGACLRDLLPGMGFAWVVRLEAFLRGLDWSLFTSAYTGTGPRPYHPRLLIGLILVGVIEGKSSLRDLEKWAQAFLPALFVCGGLHPDHSTLGKFLTKFITQWGEEIFVAFTEALLKELALKTTVAAGDGTVLEAASSRFQTLRAEALREAAREARDAAERHPQEAPLQEAAQRAEGVAAEAERRQAERDQQGKNPNPVRMAPHEPECALLKGKRGGYFPAYTPSILVSPEQLIVGQRVEPTSETAALGSLLDQHEALTGDLPRELYLDAGYHDPAAWEALMERGVAPLCPKGANGAPAKESSQGKILKDDLTYEEASDTYRCPQGVELTPGARGTQNGKGYQTYEAPAEACAACPLRSRCTDRKQGGRTVKRYADDAVKEAMAQVMRQPGAQRAYRRRFGMVEPVFGRLRTQLGLRRFRRRGLERVRGEFGLYCVAYNVKRALNLGMKGGMSRLDSGGASASGRFPGGTGAFPGARSPWESGSRGQGRFRWLGPLFPL